MSETEHSENLMEQPIDTPIQQTQHTEHGDATVEPVRPKIAHPKPLPDWKPLGSIRDYFTEQMRQDSIYKY